MYVPCLLKLTATYQSGYPPLPLLPLVLLFFSLVLLLRESVFNFISRPLRVANRQTALSLEKINASKKRSQILT